MNLRKLWQLPARIWWGSLPLRVVVSTLGASLLVLLLGGILLINQAANGILEARKSAIIVESETVINRMQQDLRVNDSKLVSINERLNQLAGSTSTAEAGYRVVIEGNVSTLVSPGLSAESVPEVLREQVRADDGWWITSTLVQYADSTLAPEPGWAVATKLYAPLSGESYPVYLIFPATNEVAILHVLTQAVISTGIVLTLALAVVAYLVSLQVVGPIRRASKAATRLASGKLDERIGVKGTDDLASLATSMNHMASELQSQITQLGELSRLQQRFVSDVSHELRTPLTTVKMAADMLYESKDGMPPTARRSTELMHNELERFEALLTDLLEISRFDAGAVTLTIDDHDLADIAQREVEAQTPFAQAQGSELRLHTTGPAIAQVDARRIQRIIRNLLTNAIEHGEHRPIDITVAENDEAVAISVRDYGIGFEQSAATEVFERFWRADPSRSRVVGGTGLGLAISLEDARLHHGWLSAWGRVGQGALFRLTLPKFAGKELQSSPLPAAPAYRPRAEEDV